MADKFGYKKGARGIDGQDGQGFENMGRSKSAEDAMYGRCWGEGGKGDITGESGMGHPGSGGGIGKSALRSAVGGKRKIGGGGGRGGSGMGHK